MAADEAGKLAGTLQVVVAYSPAARQVVEVALVLPAGTLLQDALAASGLLQRFAELAAQQRDAGLLLGIWGRKAGLQQPLRDGDRVEIYRPLQVDPKVARRERFARQGARGTGLFARRRPGAKPGY